MGFEDFKGESSLQKPTRRRAKRGFVWQSWKNPKSSNSGGRHFPVILDCA
jgi:hypothetical protein